MADLGNQSRRVLLKRGLAATLGNAGFRAGTLGGVSALVPVRAHAFPYAVALSAASTVMGMVAAHNSSDGGMGAILKASLEYQRVMAAQLASIQTGMADCLERLNAIPQQLQDGFKYNRAKELQVMIAAAVGNYVDNAVPKAASFSTFEDWCNNKYVSDLLSHIAWELDTALQKVIAEPFCDALTGVQLSYAAYAALAVKSALGLNDYMLRQEATRYLTIFGKIEDPKFQDSAAASLSEHLAQQDIAKSELKRKGLPDAAFGTPGVYNLGISIVGVHDYVPQIIDTSNCDGGASHTPTAEYRNASYMVAGKEGPPTRPCHGKITQYERNGATEWFGISLPVKQEPLVSTNADGSTVSVSQFADSELDTHRIAPQGGMAPKPADASTPEARLAFAKQYGASVGSTTKTAVSELVDRYNLHTAHIAVNTSALIAIGTTRLGLYNFFPKGGAA